MVIFSDCDSLSLLPLSDVEGFKSFQSEYNMGERFKAFNPGKLIFHSQKRVDTSKYLCKTGACVSYNW